VRRKRGHLIVGVVAGGLALGLAAKPAAAHAELLSTEPGQGEVLASPPAEVLLRFNEPVDAPDDVIEVYGSSGDQLDVGARFRPDGDQSLVAVELPELDDGAYVVTWRVTSTDSHPIRGGFTFRVGEAGSAADAADAQALMQELVAGEGGDTTVGVVFGVARFVALAGMVLLVGGGLFLLLLWPDGAVSPRRTRRLLTLGWGAALVGSVASVGLQGAYAAGESLGGSVDPERIGEVLETRPGRVWLLRLVLLVVVAGAGSRLLPRVSAGAVSGLRSLPARWRTDRARLVSTLGLSLALLATVSFAGHAAAGDLVPLALLTDVLHLAAVSLWLGGLTLLILVVLRRPDPLPAAGQEGPAPEPAPAAETDERDLEAVVRGFSALAFAAVVTIVITGTIQGVRQTQGFQALGDTTYGRLLLVKVGLVVAMLAAATLSRLWVQRRWIPAVPVASSGPGAKAAADVPARGVDEPPGQPPRLAVLRRSVGVEAGLAVVVLAVTALLVNTVPGKDAVSSTWEAEIHGAAALVQLEVEPARPGPVDVRIDALTHSGGPLQVEELTADLSLPDRDIGPIPLELRAVDEAGSYEATDVDVPFAGTWRLGVIVRLSQFDQDEVTAEVPIG
jgi:copper transport protein